MRYLLHEDFINFPILNYRWTVNKYNVYRCIWKILNTKKNLKTLGQYQKLLIDVPIGKLSNQENCRKSNTMNSPINLKGHFKSSQV